MRTRIVLILLCLLAAVPVFGLEPYLVKDINPEPAQSGSYPSSFATLDGAVLFTAGDGLSGQGLWRSDGTAAGTWQLAEICPAGSPCAMPTLILAVVNGRCFLAGGSSVWVTDGTVAGTLRLTGEDLVMVSPEVAWLPEQRALYFAADDGVHGQELWRTDGTPAGTYLVVDLVPGWRGSFTWTLTAFRGQVWFASRTEQGSSVWRSDGTERGTVLVKGSAPAGSLQGLPSIRGIVGKRLLFSGRFGRQGMELWASDGTERGTSPILRLRGGQVANIHDSVVQNGRLFFVANHAGHGQELWVSDGTARGTRAISDIPGKEPFFSSSGGHSLYLSRTSLAGRFLFRAWDAAHGVELWTTDGTTAGTRLVRDVCPGPCHGVQDVLITSRGLFYFSGTDGVGGLELWATDGTASGTRLVHDICHGFCGSQPDAPSRFEGRLLFAADDGLNGRELWATDGTAAGTVRLTGLAPREPESSFLGAALPGRFLFSADDGEHGPEVWTTDGTAAGTSLVMDINQSDFGGSQVSGLRALGDDALFFADDGGLDQAGHALWRSDGTAEGTRLVAELVAGQDSSQPPSVLASAVAGEKLFLLLFGYDGYSLWRTDGTAAGTLRLRPPASGLVLWSASELRAVGGTVFFTLFGGDLGTRLWATDSTAANAQAGTRQVVDSGPGKALFNPFGLVELDGRLLFFATAMDGSFGLWRSDGTAPGTVQVKSFGAPYGAVPLPTLHAGRLWFFAVAPSGFELWTSDGTAPGTRTVPGFAALQPSFMASTGTKLMISGLQGLWATDGSAETLQKVGPRLYDNAPGIPWTVFQGRLVYAVDEHLEGYPKLWTSDGTETGTAPLLDRDGKSVPAAIGFASLGDRLIFTTGAPPAVWQTDGTAAGTFPIALMRPTGLSSGAVVRAGDRVFFGAWDPATGQELWAVEP